MQDDLVFPLGGKHASQAYWNALTKLRMAWKEVFDEDLPTVGNQARSAFEQAISLMKGRLSSDAIGSKKLRGVLDVKKKEDIAEVLLGWADMDDLSPKIVKQAIRQACYSLGFGRHRVRDLLRIVLDDVFAESKTRRPRVGANRHWPRLLQYLRELEHETNWSVGCTGVRLVNLGAGGAVARKPRDPAKLMVKVDPDYV